MHRIPAPTDPNGWLESLGIAQYVVIGALDLLFVVLAISVLHQGPQWSGSSSSARNIGP